MAAISRYHYRTRLAEDLHLTGLKHENRDQELIACSSQQQHTVKHTWWEN